MTLITLQDGKVVVRDGKVGTEEACCCEQESFCELSPAATQKLKDTTIKLTFSGFTNSGSVGEISEDECEDCFNSVDAAGALDAWAAHWNSLEVELSFSGVGELGELVWKGNTGSVSTPSGGNATYYYLAQAFCENGLVILLLSVDFFGGCSYEPFGDFGEKSDSSPFSSAPEVGLGGNVPLADVDLDGTIGEFSNNDPSTVGATLLCGDPSEGDCLEVNYDCGAIVFGDNGTLTIDVNQLP